MKPIEFNNNVDAKSGQWNSSIVLRGSDVTDAEQLYSLVGLLVLEGRLPVNSSKGRMVGPHAYHHGDTDHFHHVCDRSELCTRAYMYRDHLCKLGRHGLPFYLEVALIPQEHCTLHKANSLYDSSLGPSSHHLADSHVEESSGFGSDPMASKESFIIEQWSIRLLSKRPSGEPPGPIEPLTSLLQTLVSYLHFSQLSAWLVESSGQQPRNVAYRIVSPLDMKTGTTSLRSDPQFQSFSFPRISCGESKFLEVSLMARPKPTCLPKLILSCSLCLSPPADNISTHKTTKEICNKNIVESIDPVSSDKETIDSDKLINYAKLTQDSTFPSTVKVTSSVSANSFVNMVSTGNKRPSSIFNKSLNLKSKHSKTSPNEPECQNIINNNGPRPNELSTKSTTSNSENAGQSSTKKLGFSLVKSRRKTTSESVGKDSFYLPLHNSKPCKQTLVSPMVLYSEDNNCNNVPLLVSSMGPPSTSSKAVPSTSSGVTSRMSKWGRNQQTEKDLTPYPRKETLEDVITEFSLMEMRTALSKAKNSLKHDIQNNNSTLRGSPRHRLGDSEGPPRAKKKRENCILFSAGPSTDMTKNKQSDLLHLSESVGDVNLSNTLKDKTLFQSEDTRQFTEKDDLDLPMRKEEVQGRKELKGDTKELPLRGRPLLLNGRLSRSRCTGERFNWRTKLPLQSSPVPLKRNSSGKFDSDGSMPKLKAARSAVCMVNLGAKEADVEVAPEEDSSKWFSSSAPVSTSSSTSLVVNFEESMLTGRIQPVGVVEGFCLEVGASGSFCPAHMRLPIAAYFFHLSEDNAPSPYLGYVDLTQLANKRGFHVPKKGSLQLTLFNPSGTVLKMFVVLYDLSDMPPNAQTFLRQRTLYTPVSMVSATHRIVHRSSSASPIVSPCTDVSSSSSNEKRDSPPIANRKPNTLPFIPAHGKLDTPPSSPSDNNHTPLDYALYDKRGAKEEHQRNSSGSSSSSRSPPGGLQSYLRYLVHLRFHTTKSGKLYLHTDIRLIFSRDKFEFDPRIATYELRSFTETPQNPRYSPKR